MNNTYLIPANTKRSMLILGLFTQFDLIMFGTGLGITLLALMIVPLESITITILAIAPALVTGFLVIPVPNYINVRMFLTSAFTFFTTRQRFIWKGWCFLDEENSKK